PRALTEAGIKLRIETVDTNDPHPNTYRLTLRNSRELRSLIAISTGGGMMEVISVDGVPMSMDGGYCETLVWLNGGAEKLRDALKADVVHIHPTGRGQIVQIQSAAFVTPDAITKFHPVAVRHLSRVLPVPSRRNMRVPFSTCAEMLAHDGAK